MRCLAFLLLVVFTFHLVSAQAPTEVKITSRVPNQPSPLQVRCQSKDTDIGMHTLYEDQEIHWHFHRKMWSTLFFCHFYWNSKDRRFAVFDLRISSNHCKSEPESIMTECFWEARPDGFYIDDGDNWTKINDWN
ncbi:hypothetical protein Vadar_017661 [Vaccinium darrowii]|uniref:Uncharacterized protein n=1 Tax=Vaccinium darrowii TaxID=229202 RepID=A0ACB7Y8Y9_9ERIC|nr:hypothetical protein Vadar_017661 [Vaccinium darrowii]